MPLAPATLLWSDTEHSLPAEWVRAVLIQLYFLKQHHWNALGGLFLRFSPAGGSPSQRALRIQEGFAPTFAQALINIRAPRSVSPPFACRASTTSDISPDEGETQIGDLCFACDLVKLARSVSSYT